MRHFAGEVGVTDLPCLDAYRREEARIARVRVGPRVSVRCWVCGMRARRRRYTLSHVVGQRGTVRQYGTCPCDRGGWTCGGAMLRRADRRRVLRAALRHERGGYNRVSEYDL